MKWAILLATALGVSAQNGDAVNWATGVAGQFATVSNPVVSSWALARLGELTCEQDRGAGSAMFRLAVGRIHAIPADVFFDDQVGALPISSFTGLWKMVAAGAIQCDPGLAGLINVPAFEQRRNDEKQRANNSLIGRAMDRHEEDPERAAQLVDLLLTVGDPAAIDFDGLELFLAGLRERAPELADQVFGTAVVTAVTSEGLHQLGKYLFVDPEQWMQPDVRNLFRVLPVGGFTLFDFGKLRTSANREAVGAFVRALVRFSGANVGYEASILYSLALQSLRHARELELMATDDLEKLLPQLAVTAETSVARAVGAVPAERDAGEAGNRSRRAREVLTAASRKRFAEARAGLGAVGDAVTTRQLGPVVDFAEAAAAITAGDLQRAVQLTNGIQPGGVKRSLLYAGIMAVAEPQVGDGLLALAAKDASELPAEFRASMFCALASVLMERDPEGGLRMLQEAVTALNAARAAPRQARFDPRRARGTQGSTAGSGTTTDIVGIPQAVNRFYEVIDTGVSRFHYELAVPRVGAMTVAGVIARAGNADPQRLQVLVSGLRDAAKQAEALLAVAELRLETQ